MGIQAQWVDDPAPGRGVGHLEARRHAEFLQKGDAGENPGAGGWEKGETESWTLGNSLILHTYFVPSPYTKPFTYISFPT